MREVQPQLNPEDQELMEKLLSAGHLEHTYAVRLQTVLLREKGKGTGEISEFLGIHQTTVSLYINRYNENGLYRVTCTEKPEGETHWYTGLWANWD